MLKENQTLSELTAEGEVAAKRKVYRRERESALQEFDAQMDDLKRRALQIVSAVREDLDEDMHALGEKRKRFVSRLAGLREASGDDWGDLRKGVDDSWDELEDAFADLRKGVNAAIGRFRARQTS
jgi:hypothetical protein